MPELEECRLLARGNRLSVIPLTEAEFDGLLRQVLKVYGSRTERLRSLLRQPLLR